MGVRRKILLVAEDPAVRKALAAKIKEKGYAVSAVKGEQGATNVLLTSGEAEAVVIYCRNPKKCGEELIRWVKRNRGVPVVFTSDGDVKDFYGIADAAGADVIVSKEELLLDLPTILAGLARSARPFGL